MMGDVLFFRLDTKEKIPKNLKSFCQFTETPYFCFVVYAIIILQIKSKKQKISINKNLYICVVKKEVSPL